MVIQTCKRCGIAHLFLTKEQLNYMQRLLNNEDVRYTKTFSLSLFSSKADDYIKELKQYVDANIFTCKYHQVSTDSPISLNNRPQPQINTEAKYEYILHINDSFIERQKTGNKVEIHDSIKGTIYCPICGEKLPSHLSSGDMEFGDIFGDLFGKGESKQTPQTDERIHLDTSYVAPQYIEPEARLHMNIVHMSDSATMHDSIDKSKEVSIKEFLQCAISIEKHTKIVSDMLVQLYGLQNLINRQVTINKYNLIREKYQKVILIKEKILSIDHRFPIIDEQDIDYHSEGLYEPTLPIKPEKPKLTAPIKPVIIKPSIFNKKKVLEENRLAEERYEKELYNYNCKTKEYEQDMELYDVGVKSHFSKTLT